MESNMNEFDEIALELKRLKNIDKWKIDLSKLKDGVYNGDIYAPIDITEFKGFKEELGIYINEVNGSLSFAHCEKLTNIGVLPETTTVLIFTECISLTSIDRFPKSYTILCFIENVPMFKDMTIEQINEKYGNNISLLTTPLLI